MRRLGTEMPARPALQPNECRFREITPVDCPKRAVKGPVGE